MKITLLLSLLLAAPLLVQSINNPRFNMFWGPYKDVLAIDPETIEYTKESDAPLFPYDPIHGYIPVYEEGNEMFYWLFKAKNNPDTAPIVIWLQGGPGCASTMGLFVENGPLYVKNYNGKEGEKKADIRDIAWNQNANLLFPDQPIGTGFSTVTEDRKVVDQWDVKDGFLRFYKGFLKKHPEYKGREVYITGESYGGHWVPYTAAALANSGDPDINLAGVGIGNGFISAGLLFPSYPSFSYKYPQYTKLTEEKYTYWQKEADLCKQMAARKNPMFSHSYYDVCNNINNIENLFPAPFSAYYMPGHAPSNNSYYYFLNDPEVRAYLGVKKSAFHACSDDSFKPGFDSRDFIIDSRTDIIHLLGLGKKVLVYDGDLDWICNYQQEELAMNTMNWPYRGEFENLELKKCDYGICKRYKNLWYVRFADSGHLVPVFKPQKALDMINELINWTPTK